MARLVLPPGGGTGEGGEGPEGPPGLSAYEIAVDEGFVGTVEEWLDSLVGEDGADSTVPGPPGDDGADGADSTVPGPPGDDGADGQGVPTGGTTAQVLAKASNADFDTEWATPEAGGGGGAGTLILNFHSDASATVTLTNQVSGEQYLSNNNRNITKIDLSEMTECRLITRVVAASASVNTPRLKLQYHTSFTTTVGTNSPIGTSEVATSLSALGVIDSGWIPLVAGAKADVFVTVLQEGGDAAADPGVGMVVAHFR